MNWELADGWSWQPLHDLVVPVRVQVAPSDIDPSWQYTGLEHVKPGTGEYEGIPAGEAGIKSAKYLFETGDLLYGKLRPNLRKCVIATNGGVCSTDLMPLRPTAPEAAHLLAVQLRSEAFTNRVMRMVGGANLPRINVEDLLTIEVPVPPEGERQRLYDSVSVAKDLRGAVRALERSILHVEAAATAWALGIPGAAPGRTLRAVPGS